MTRFRKMKLGVFLALSGTLLTSCGGGGGGQVSEIVRVANVSRDILLRCLSLPSTLDEALLGCLSGKISLGKDSSGNECSVSFSSDHLNIVSGNLIRDVLYQPGSGSKTTTFAYDKFYSPETGHFNFSVTASSAGAPYFGFSFSNNANAGGGTATFGFQLTPELPAPPGVVLQCTVQI